MTQAAHAQSISAANLTQGSVSPSLGPINGTANVEVVVPLDVQQVDGSRSATYILAGGRVYAAGDNSRQQLGLPAGTSFGASRSERPWLDEVPIPLPNEVSIAQLAGGGFASSHVLDTNGRVWSWGYDDNRGVFGTGRTNEYRLPSETPVPPGVTFNQIRSGTYSTLGLTPEGELWGWGSNINGVLQSSATAGNSAPKKLALPEGVEVADFIVGNYYVLILSTEGELWGWGERGSQVLGGNDYTVSGNTVQIPLPEGVSFTQIEPVWGAALGLTNEGKIYAWGTPFNYTNNPILGRGVENVPTPTLLPLPAELQDIVFASLHAGTSATNAGALTANGTLYIWGSNTNGELGIGTSNSTGDEIPRLVPGTFATYSKARNSLAINEHGQAMTWGSNSNGSLGLGNMNTPITSPQTAFNFEVSAISFGEKSSVGELRPHPENPNSFIVSAPPHPVGTVDLTVDTVIPQLDKQGPSFTISERYRYYDPAIPIFSNNETHYEVTNDPGVIADGDSAQIITAQLTDEAYDKVSGMSDSLTASTTRDLGGGSVSDFSETELGVYTAQITSFIAGEAPIIVSYTSPDGKTVNLNVGVDAAGHPLNSTATFQPAPTIPNKPETPEEPVHPNLPDEPNTPSLPQDPGNPGNDWSRVNGPEGAFPHQSAHHEEKLTQTGVNTIPAVLLAGLTIFTGGILLFRRLSHQRMRHPE
ncbi:hypothetical protein [Lysinibacter sp. HNR]|uniref:RCC1 domain-containing protein n=1 Tax=Lysinibacter sp. HNR TaxID=3031408 RepID=UPI0024348882|nr:hypothetical protein [Lysinibacter sp. HNR]WGD36257.1 hypothetical protein FrondiHNR_07110 [Lysinibacter sp. HNR]